MYEAYRGQRIIESGLATNMTSAVQLSLALVAHQIVKAKPLKPRLNP